MNTFFILAKTTCKNAYFGLRYTRHVSSTDDQRVLGVLSYNVVELRKVFRHCVDHFYLSSCQLLFNPAQQHFRLRK